MQDITVFLQAHWQLTSLFVLLLCCLFLIEFIRLKMAARQVTPAQLTNLINHEKAAVIDVRPAAVYAQGHILDSISLPFADFAHKLKKIERLKTHPVVVVCAKGFEASKVAAILQKKGFHVQVLGGGISSWTNAELPLIKASTKE